MRCLVEHSGVHAETQHTSDCWNWFKGVLATSFIWIYLVTHSNLRH